MLHDKRVAALVVVTGAGLLMGGAGIASAETLNFSVQQSTTPSEPLGFTQFNTLLGTLTEIDITLSNSIIGDGSEVSLTGGEGNGMAGFTASLDVIGPSSTLETGGASASATCNDSGGSCDSGLQAPTSTSTIAPNPVVITNRTLFAPHEGRNLRSYRRHRQLHPGQ